VVGRPGTSSQLPSSRSVAQPHHGGAPGLSTPYSAGNSPYSTAVSLPSREALLPQQPTMQAVPSMTPGQGPPPTNPPTKSLCAGLVVPPFSECVLAIRALGNGPASSYTSPELPQVGAPASQKLNVLDLQGKPVMKANIVRPWPVDAAFKRASPVVMLSTTTAQREERLTFCRAGGEGGGRRSMYIYDKDDVLFGCIKRDVTRPRYVLTSSRGSVQVLFEGNFSKHMVSVVSDSKDMMAHAEPCNMPQDPSGQYYQVRVAEGVDVGLIVSGLLSIDAMETM